jgi:hypothetical protein
VAASHGYPYAGDVRGLFGNARLEDCLRKGKHEAPISMEIYERVQARLTGERKAPARSDLRTDFPSPRDDQPRRVRKALHRVGRKATLDCGTRTIFAKPSAVPVVGSQ